jgi:hypothetical protein
MDRRGFLQGVFGGVAAAGTGLIVSATTQEIEAFESPLAKGDPVMLDANTATASLGQHLYNERGELVAVVTHIDGFHGESFNIRAVGTGQVFGGRHGARIRGTKP